VTDHDLTPAQRDAAAIVEALLAEHPELDTMEALHDALALKLAEK
jgi:hypothetical protein